MFSLKKNVVQFTLSIRLSDAWQYVLQFFPLIFFVQIVTCRWEIFSHVRGKNFSVTKVLLDSFWEFDYVWSQKCYMLHCRYKTNISFLTSSSTSFTNFINSCKDTILDKVKVWWNFIRHLTRKLQLLSASAR